MRRSKQLVAIITLGATVAVACAANGNGERAPQANVAETLAAQRAFRSIHRAWTSALPEARGHLEPRLRDFLSRYPLDRRVRTVRIYLAWLLTQRGRVAEARALVALSRKGAVGTARDFAAVAEAAILLREGKPDQALSVLTPLEGKIVDADERFMFGEQQVLAALAARRHTVAVQHMLEWLWQSAPEDRDAVQGRVHELTQGLAPEPLERSLSDLARESESTASNPDAVAARDWLLDVIADRLARHALERADGELARRLLDSGVTSFHRGARGAALARIAAEGSILPQVAGRSVGLVLSVGSAEQRRRSAQVAAGMATALGLPESASNAESVQLVTGDEDGGAGSMQRALSALAGEGAAILVAGVDGPSAARAAEYSEEADIPLILLTSSKVAADGFAFALGADEDAQVSALESGLRSAGATTLARVGAGGVPCDVAPKLAGLPRFPVDEWKRNKVDGVLVLAGPLCARDVAREAAGSGRRVWLGLGLESAELLSASEVGSSRIAAAAGAFPYRASSPSPEDLKRFVARTGRPPSWYAAMGHDAAVLAQAAFKSFALERVDDARVVSQLHRQAQRELASVQVDLWTTDARGFGGARVLPRTITTAAAAATVKKGKP